MHIQSRADDDAGNGMMAIVMMVRIIVFMMDFIIPEGHRQADQIVTIRVKASGN